MNAYEGRVPIYHFDLYRLAGAPDIADLGFEDFIGEGVVIVEWGEKVPFAVPAVTVRIKVLANERRRIEICLPGRPRKPEFLAPVPRLSKRGKGRNHSKAATAKRGHHENR
jgi:tRNA threonylcarbamoyladenosine biosynthesis protein TsaE